MAQPGTLRFTAAMASIGEGAGSVTLTVERVSGTDGAVSVNYATATIQVPILEDTLVEGNETFTVTLSNPSGGAMGWPSLAMLLAAGWIRRRRVGLAT